jgi:hypothetical protein
MGFEPMNTGFADLQGAFAPVCTRFVPIVDSMDYRFHSQRIQALLNRYPLHFPLQCLERSEAFFNARVRAYLCCKLLPRGSSRTKACATR